VGPVNPDAIFGVVLTLRAGVELRIELIFTTVRAGVELRIELIFTIS